MQRYVKLAEMNAAHMLITMIIAAAVQKHASNVLRHVKE
ncbi:hypothetical protein KR50_11310 [Jeotgalibacillus campisalis]|uniref:Uncharacterized protein n=1 Tax=Jeotgalibacillus campisalis TaxID=220754 RepID=A0A0C2VXF4_9BACL|nr:hypothetical protein KR50_11310 [Jeotgalibacillus campisalis]